MLSLVAIHIAIALLELFIFAKRLHTSASRSMGALVESPVPNGLEETHLVRKHQNRAGSSFEEEDARTILLPDLFISIMSPEPRINPNYDTVRAEADEFARQMLHLSDDAYKKHVQADFTLLAAMWIPDANAEGLRIMADWLIWVFYFDDMFDVGHLRDDPEAAGAETEATLALLCDSHEEISPREHPLRYMQQSVWQRICKGNPQVIKRYQSSMAAYIHGVVKQVDVRFSSTKLDVDLYLHFRRESVGLHPCHAILEHAHGVDLPQDVLDHFAVKDCVLVSIDLVLLQNDILSYRKEKSLDVMHNLVHIFCREGSSAQEAVDKVGQLIQRSIRQWHHSLLDIPIWGEKIDKQLQKYLKGCLELSIGNLNWSYATGRYLGRDGPEVRATRVLRLDS
ncbi:hypothetical protein SCAR479_00548 [Seiridium cardinale]|uniref:Terpene synthase n=1 Tax=Seiridium cardinale TaxID=138064 RepID=A0ABR2Y9V4_9PEZI